MDLKLRLKTARGDDLILAGHTLTPDEPLFYVTHVTDPQVQTMLSGNTDAATKPLSERTLAVIFTVNTV